MPNINVVKIIHPETDALLATAELTEGREVRILGKCDPVFLAVLEGASVEVGFEEVHDFQTGAHGIIQRPVQPTKVLSPGAFVQVMRERGYIMYRADPAIEDEIKNVLKRFEGHPIQKEILDQLPTMSYLQQTALFEELKDVIGT